MNKGLRKLKKNRAMETCHGISVATDLQLRGRARFQKKSMLIALAIGGLLYGGGAASQELTASSSSAAAGLATGFNQAVAEARSLDFTSANYPHFVALGWPSTDARCSQSTLQPGYLASIPNRCAYYSRDYVHYATGAYFLGMYEQNYQMADHFATLYHTDIVNAPYWAIGANGKQYEQNDESPAPFEIGENIANMYRLTADQRYLGADFTNYINNINNGFSNTESNKYINADGFRMARLDHGEAATYNEFVGNAGVPSTTAIVLGGDMAASEIAYYRNVSNYPALKAASDATNMTAKFNTLSSNFNSHWSNVNGSGHFAVALTGVTSTAYSSANYNTLSYYDHYAEEPNLFPLYKGIITDAGNLAAQANYVDSNAESLYQAAASQNPNYGLNSPGVESHTYLPTAFYNAGMLDTAWKWLTRLAARQVFDNGNAYPEVSFALISDVITKVLGVDFDAPNNKLVTLANNLPSAFKNGDYIKVSNIPIHTSNYTVHVGVTQALDAATGRPAITLDYAKDPSAQQDGTGLYWLPRFKLNYGSHCNVLTTYANNSTQANTYNLVWDGNSRTYTCNGDKGGIYLYPNDPNYTVTRMLVTASQ